MALQITPFEEAIKKYLDEYASKDSSFAEKYNNPDKSIEKCCQYIYQEVRKSLGSGQRQAAVEDQAIYGIAVHYFDEDDIEVSDEKIDVEAVAVTEEKPAKKRGRKPKAEKAAEAKVEVEDDDMPEPLDIPLF